MTKLDIFIFCFFSATMLGVGCRPTDPQEEEAVTRRVTQVGEPSASTSEEPAPQTSSQKTEPPVVADRAEEPLPKKEPLSEKEPNPPLVTPKTEPSPPNSETEKRENKAENKEEPKGVFDFSEEELEQFRKEAEEAKRKREEEMKKIIAALGPPLVDAPTDLVRLHPAHPIWIDKKRRSVVMVGAICQRKAPLELFVCLRYQKSHEAVVSVYAQATTIHTALIAVGAKQGAPVQYEPKYVPASGTEIEVTVAWKDEQGQVHRAAGQQWVRNAKTKKAMQYNWVFGGSYFWKSQQGENLYAAEGGNFICVSNFPSALLDLPIKSSEMNSSLMFEAFTENIPPRDTAVTVILKPVTP